jgi:hypothetical protein
MTQNNPDTCCKHMHAHAYLNVYCRRLIQQVLGHAGCAFALWDVELVSCTSDWGRRHWRACKTSQQAVGGKAAGMFLAAEALRAAGSNALKLQANSSAPLPAPSNAQFILASLERFSSWQQLSACIVCANGSRHIEIFASVTACTSIPASAMMIPCVSCTARQL